MSNIEFLPLPDNPDCYEDLKDANCYFVDKTEYLKAVFTSSTKVLLFTRPRRFGKTLLMTMFESFLRVNPEKPFDTSFQQKYFKGTKILEDKEFCSKFMGQYPVISISLKNVDGVTFDIAYKNFAAEVSKLAENYRYLFDQSRPYCHIAGISGRGHKMRFTRYRSYNAPTHGTAQSVALDPLKLSG